MCGITPEPTTVMGRGIGSFKHHTLESVWGFYLTWTQQQYKANSHYEV